MTFDPESYTISIRKENHDGESYYVGRVAEFPNISSFEDSYEESHALVIDAILTLKKIADESQVPFPAPYPQPTDEFSGRITLRLPKTLHAKVSKKASQEEVSVNQYVVTAIATYVGETDGIAKFVSEVSKVFLNRIDCVVTSAMNTITYYHKTQSSERKMTSPKFLLSPSTIDQRYQVVVI